MMWINSQDVSDVILSFEDPMFDSFSYSFLENKGNKEAGFDPGSSKDGVVTGPMLDSIFHS